MSPVFALFNVLKIACETPTLEPAKDNRDMAPREHIIEILPKPYQS